MEQPNAYRSPGRPAALGWRADAQDAMRTLAAVTVAAVGLALLVGWVGGRLAMRLLALLNPEVDGMISDDGFTMGRVTVGGTYQLLISTVQLGLIAATCYLVVRHLAIGPRWFRVVSVAVGAGTVVGNALVHPDGVDFTLLDPPLLAVGLFLVIPIVYVAALTIVAERFLAEDSWFRRADSRVVAAVTALCWAFGGPMLLILGVIVAVWSVWRVSAHSRFGESVRHPATGWTCRAVLAVAFAASVSGLASDIAAVT